MTREIATCTYYNDSRIALIIRPASERNTWVSWVRPNGDYCGLTTRVPTAHLKNIRPAVMDALGVITNHRDA